jgi:O-antigen/teichoic acid export membrane protein
MENEVSNNHRIAKNTLFLYLRMFLTMAVSLYTVRIILQVLTIEDYGIYSAVGGVILSFGFISNVLANASQRYFSYELGKGKKGRVNETFNTIFIIYLGISLLITLIAETIGVWFLQNKMSIPDGRADAAMWVYQFALISFIVTILSNPFQAMIIAKEKMNLYAYLSILDVTLKLIIVFFLMMSEFDKLKLYAVLVFVTQFFTNIIYVVYCRRKYSETYLIWRFEGQMFKSIFSYSSWTLFGTLSGICNTQGVNIMLNIFYGPVANTAYSIASQVYHTVGMFANNFYTAVKPPLIKSFSAKNYEYVQKLFTFSSKTIFTLLFVMILPLLINTKEILQLWLGNVGQYMVIFVQLSLIYILIVTLSYPITTVVQAGGHVKLYHGLVDGFSLLVLPIVYVLFKLNFHASWAYITSIIIFTIAHIFRIYVIKKVFVEFSVRDYISHSLLPMVLISTCSYIFMLFIKGLFDKSIMNVIFVSIIAVLLVLAACFFLLLSKTERYLIIKTIKIKKIKS